VLDPPIGCASAICAASSACFVVGIAALAASWITGEAAWIEQFFRIPAPGEPMRTTCFLITSSLCSAVPGSPSARTLRLLSRPAALARLTALDLFAAYIARNVVDVVVAGCAGKLFGAAEIANWPTDPAVLVLLAEAMLLRRSVHQMGAGWISQYWTDFSVGVFLTALGDVGLSAELYGYLRYPWNEPVFVWLPAAACFTVQPRRQRRSAVVAIRSGTRRRSRP
jgi:hypothetical protein